MKKWIVLVSLLLAATAGQADYRWSQEFEEVSDFRLILFLNGDSVTQIVDLDSGRTSFDTTLNLDSIGRGLFQLKAKYKYSNTTAWISVTDDYDNSRGEADGVAIARIYALDTAASMFVPGSKISIWTYGTGGGNIYKQTKTTAGAGYADFYLAQSGQYRAYAADPAGYSFSPLIFTVDTGSSATSIDTILGYGVSAPAPTSAVNYVTAYIDVTEGPVDTTGSIIPRTDATIWVILGGYGSTTPRIGTLWGILPKEYSAKVNASGRAVFRVPANTIITPSNTHWEVSWSATGTSSMFARKSLFKVRLDTIPDPVNLLTATRVN